MMESSIPDLQPADGPAPIARRNLQDAMDEHARMIRHLEARDDEAPALVLAQHMERTWDRVQGTLE